MPEQMANYILWPATALLILCAAGWVSEWRRRRQAEAILHLVCQERDGAEELMLEQASQQRLRRALDSIMATMEQENDEVRGDV